MTSALFMSAVLLRLFQIMWRLWSLGKPCVCEIQTLLLGSLSLVDSTGFEPVTPAV
jgi:hypothetical protein